jgi:hypothetical protein
MLEGLQAEDRVRGRGGNEHILLRQLRRRVQAACEGCCEERVTKDHNSVKTVHTKLGGKCELARRNGSAENA